MKIEMKHVIEIRFFMNGDETGTLHTREFESNYECNRWKERMGNSIEVFSDKVISKREEIK